MPQGTTEACLLTSKAAFSATLPTAIRPAADLGGTSFRNNLNYSSANSDLF
jgi:hypothetical protein